MSHGDGAPPFVVLALPRSRTFWTSRFLSYGGWHCGHEECLRLRSLADVRSWLAQPLTGTVETAAAPFWRLLLRLRPDTRIALIRRPVAEVTESLLAQLPFDPPALMTQMRRLDAKLDQIEQRCPGVLSVSYAELATEAGCAELFEHCLPFQHDPLWWQRLAGVHLQIDLAAMLRYCQAHQAQLNKMAATARHRIMADMATNVSRETDGVTFQTEPYTEALLHEGLPLLKEHLVLMDQSPDDWDKRNLPLYQSLQNLGALHCMTARCNGRLFGYLVSIVAPSLDRRDRTEAMHTIFFASPAIRNLGMKLQRAAVADLKACGVSDVFMRTGVRTVDAPRLGAIYRRLGASAMGEMYRLALQEEAT